MPPNAHPPHEIDGTTLEGGGQLVRLALSIAALTNRSITIYNIRGKRPRGGGLKEQHLAAVQWLAKACNAKVEGAVLKGKDLVFEPAGGSASVDEGAKWWTHTRLPDGTQGRKVEITDMKTPGAVTLLLQAVLPVLLYTPTAPLSSSEHKQVPYLLHLRGGTNVSMSPSVDYVNQVLFPNLALLGYPHMRILSLERGFSDSRGSSGLGGVKFVIEPLQAGKAIECFELERHYGAIKNISVTILASREARSLIAEHALIALKDLQSESQNSYIPTIPAVPVKVVVNEEVGGRNRMYLLVVAEMATGIRLGRDWLWDRKAKSGSDGLREDVMTLVKRVVDELETELHCGASVDEYMEDQLVVFQALARGPSIIPDVSEYTNNESWRPSLHTRTSRWLVQDLLGVNSISGAAYSGIGFASRDRADEKALSQNEDRGVGGSESDQVVDKIQNLSFAA